MHHIESLDQYLPIEGTYYIYLITNELTGEQYVGHTKNPRNRWGSHQKPSFKGRCITDAILLHGAQNFEMKVIKTVKGKQLAEQVELAMIAALGTLHPKGYNKIGEDVCADTSKRRSEAATNNWHGIWAERRATKSK